jgi:hypothetical protein
VSAGRRRCEEEEGGSNGGSNISSAAETPPPGSPPPQGEGGGGGVGGNGGSGFEERAQNRLCLATFGGSKMLLASETPLIQVSNVPKAILSSDNPHPHSMTSQFSESRRTHNP